MMALADFHYTTGISSGFKVYILEGQPSYENEQRFRRLPANRLPVYPIKRKLTVDGRRSPDLTLERQKLLKRSRRSTCVTTAVSLEQKTSPLIAQASVGAVGTSCVSTSRPEPCPGSQALHPCCPQKCPLRKSLLDSALTVSQLQQMRPSVITCAPRRSCSEAPTSTSPSISSLEPRSSVIPGGSSSPQKRHRSWTTSLVGPSARLNGEASPKQRVEDKAEKSLSPSP